MNSRTAWLAGTIRSLGAAPRTAILMAAVLFAYLFCAPVAWKVGGLSGLCASGLAAATCLAGAVGALLISLRLGGAFGGLPSLAGGMMFRLGLPLLSGLVAVCRGGPSDRVFLCWLIAFYLVALAVETLLTLPELSKELTIDG